MTSQLRLLTAVVLALAFTLAMSELSMAQHLKGEEGTGGAAGYSPPPMDMPDAAAPSNAPPLPSDGSASEPPPEPDTAQPEEDKKEGDQPSDEPTGADQPD